MADAKEKLVEFLNRRAFDPVLKKSPDDYSGAEKKKLDDVQDATRAEKKRFADLRERCGSEAHVRRRPQLRAGEENSP